MKKSFMTRMLAVSLSAAMTFSLSSASSLTGAEAAVKKLPANAKKASVSLKVGKSKTLQLKNYKTWNIKKAKSNKTAIVKVKKQSGTNVKVKITGKKAGKATVTLTLKHQKNAKDPITKKVKVTVKEATNTNTDTTPTDTTPTDTTPTTPVTTPTDSAVTVTPGVLHISTAKVIKADTISVSFSSIVASTGAVKVTVTRGDGTTPIEGKCTWNAGATGLEFKSDVKFGKGTYTVKADDGKDVTTATVEVAEAQDVKEIVFLGTEALTGKGTVVTDNGGTNQNVSGRYAYVYYDVLDQYGQSVKDTFSIQWTSSANVVKNDRTTGRLTLEKNKNGKEVFTYADKIYVTGVYTKTGASKSETFNVGTEQGASSINFIGFVKKGSSTIEKTLPEDFKANEYQLVYDAYDQNHNTMVADDYLYDNSDENRTRSLTLVSENVLVIKEFLHNGGDVVTIDGVDHCAANVVPGINVNDGGDVNIKAISTKTGNTTTLNVVVGKFRILKKFDILAPATTLIDGEAIEIPFKAEDAGQQEMRNFKELATQTNFSKLTFNESAGRLCLEENDDGTARLVWYDNSSEGRWNTSSANGIDRPLSLTAIVVGGDTSNQLLQVSDRARPEGIRDVSIDTVLVDDMEQKISYGRFTFVDQYGRNMKNTYIESRKNDLPISDFAPQKDWDGEYVYDNGFFDAVENIGLNGTDYTGYDFGISVKMTGQEDHLTGLDDWGWDDKDRYTLLKGTPIKAQSDQGNGTAVQQLSYTAEENLENSGRIPEISLKFAIYKKKQDSDEQEQDICQKYSKSFKIVALDKLSNWRIGSIDKANIETDLTEYDNGQKLADYSNDNTLDLNVTNNVYTFTNDAFKNESLKSEAEDPEEQYKYISLLNDNGGGVEVEVFGTYNNNEIKVPASHYAIVKDLEDDDAEAILQTTPVKGNTVDLNNKKLTRVKASELKYSDLYDISSAHFNRRDAGETVEVNVYYPTVTETSPAALAAENIVTNLKQTALISDEYRTLTTFEAGDTVTLKPEFTYIHLADLMGDRSTNSLAYASKGNVILIKDQYGHEYFKLDAMNLQDEPKGLQWYKDYNDELQICYAYKNNDEHSKYYVGDLKFEYVVKDIVENKEGFVYGNLKVNNNASEYTTIEGAEKGDTFTVEITAKAINENTDVDGVVDESVLANDGTVYYNKGSKTVGASVDGSVSHTVKVTVGADSNCYIHDNDNFYSDSKNSYDSYGQLVKKDRVSVRDYLQYQLNEMLGTQGNYTN